MKSHIKLRDKLIFTMLIITILGNFITTSTVKAKSDKASKAMGKLGGTLLEPICDFTVFLGDTALYLLQTNFLIDQPITVEANSDEQKEWSWGGTAAIIGGAGLAIIGAALCATGVGAIAGSGLVAARCLSCVSCRCWSSCYCRRSCYWDNGN